MTIKGIISIVAMIMLVAAFSAAEMQGGQQGRQSQLASERPSINVNSRGLSGQTLTIDSVQAPERGWVVVHMDGENGPIIGQKMVNKGMNRNIEVNLNRQVPEGSQVVVMLHRDKGQKGKLELPRTDPKVEYQGKPVMKQFTYDQQQNQQQAQQNQSRNQPQQRQQRQQT